MSGIVIREVTEEDYEGVVGIRTAYGGRDYLPGLYHNILKRHKGFVAIMDEKMVAFRFMYLVDNGMTILPRAGRVHQDYEGLGVYRKLDEFTMQVYKDVKYKAVSFHNRNATLMKKVEEGAYRITLNRKLKTYRTTLKSLKSDIQKRTLQNDVKHVDSDDLKGILSNTDVTKHMFSGDIFASCWTPLRIIPENTSHVFADNGVVFGSSVDDAEKAMISIGHPVLSSIGVSYVLDFYGLQRNDVADHIVKHFTKHRRL
ncbi:hypothetical protein FSP39_024534 [Pinctada imbricata]|uniref:N-acetyltransferase domain-containing protein n=1 Tax=Pinctada imbricata TaxID=66713 RepID=A0AA88XTG0_PINIB|nr:hypothetical protein FSP39_024534 [Pinctada imbricata]